ncbi:MAG TPA: MGMT family protein [Polyangiales bacterium]|nr:MGMT family protein [Polyangiales bacterium]
MTNEQRILEVVRAIPRGKVATYGQVAELAGIARGHRIAARAMKTAPSGTPWQRVLGKKDARRAQISIQDPEHATRQRKLLTREGVHVDADGLVSLREHGWLPA